MSDRLTSTSKFLAYVLRHRPDAIGITLAEGGWVEVDVLLAALARHGRAVSSELLDRLVAGADKQRFEVRDGRIRAAQGHSVRVDLHLEPSLPPPVLYHGTVARFLPSIRVGGLQSRGRTHVHLSPDRHTAATVGARRGDPVVLGIDAAGMHAGGFTFYRAANGVWLTDRVPPQWITLPE
ncbi:putative RNA 2'-phosphotransferase [Micromonospora sonchi]|uniref:Probable RNA 2'-phosphotransferase n=1 Tax=Micromonospora sonchi TaxID=1763543 RepID=A0A917U5N1_9ACTN|nr:RNA 2'-phosphotransferase [Micromonospora sonchi]GGM58979.1 putative RNA 2'-phosphotransferase [Micromonospora sonchi]